MESIEVQACKTCGEVKPLSREFFYPHKLLKRGFTLQCKVCILAAQKAERLQKAALRPPPEVAEGFKRCPRCREIKPATLDHFGRHSSQKHGLRVRCKPCERAAALEKRRPNWKNKQVSDREGHKRCTACKQDKPATPEYFVRQPKSEYKDGLDSKCKSCLYALTNERRRRRYREDAAYKDHITAYNKARRDADPLPNRLNAKRRKARLKGAEGTYTAADWRSKLAAYKRRCHWCGENVGETPHADHLIPLHRGGTNNIGNIVPSCPTCNTSRQAKLPHEWTNRLL